jgi:hypothetical protein
MTPRPITKWEIFLSWVGIPFVFAILFAVVAWKAFKIGFNRVRQAAK